MSVAALSGLGENLYVSSVTEREKAEALVKESDRVNQDEFMELLVTQLTHQDPLKPMDNQEFISQMAQLQTLEEQVNTNEHLVNILNQNQLSAAAGMIGTHVTGTNGAGVGVEGVAVAAGLSDGEAYVQLDSGDRVPLTDVTQLTGVLVE